MKSWSPHRLLTVAFAAIFLVFASLAAATWLSAQKSTDASQWVEHTYQVRTTLDRITSKLYEAELAQRDYLLTGNPDHLRARDNALSALQRAVETAGQLIADNADQELRLRQLQALIAGRARLYRQNENIRAHDGPAAVPALITSISPMLSNLRTTVTQMLEEENRLLELRKKREASRLRATLLSSIALVAMLLIAVFTLFWRLRVDIRLRERAHAIIRANETLLKQIVDALPIAVSVADASGQLTLSNPAARALAASTAAFGAARDDRPKSARTGDAKERAMHEVMLAKAVSTGERVLNEEVEFEGADERRRFALLSAVPLRDDQRTIIGGVAVCQDVTALKQTEQQLRTAAHFDESRGRALALFNASFDRQQIAEGMLGMLADRHPFPMSALYRHDEWLGKFVCESARGLPSGISRDYAFGEGLLGQAAQNGRTMVLDVAAQLPELVIQSGVLDCRPAQVLIVPVVYQERRLAVLALAATRGLDEQEITFIESLCVQLGIALHNLTLYADTRLLADQLRMRSEEIARKNDELEAASRTKSEFVANMSHELRTPLNAIIGFSEVLKDGLAGDLSPQQTEYISDIFSSGQHLLSLINDVLDLSKVEAGKMALELEPVALDELLSNSLSIVKETAFARRVELKLDVAAGAQMIQADARKLKQVLYNLLSNAVKFGPEGGQVTLSAKRVARAEVGDRNSDRPGRTLTLPDNGDDQPCQEFLEIRVADQGIGIAPEDLERLFQPFTQIDGGLARRFEGTGLGLAMVHRLAMLHGGTVRVESAENEGSTFFVWLPWRPVDYSADAVAPVQRVRPALAESRWVLVVEDDDAAAELIRRQLESDGLKFRRAASAEAALAIATEQPFALITIDIMLPGMDGWELLGRIKQMPALAHVPVVIISIIADTNKGVSLGASAVLQKPVSHQQLRGALANLGFDTDDRTLLTLVVDDDPQAVEVIAANLPEPKFRVLRAYGGREAIEIARRRAPDIIVLDLMMPEVSGFNVVEALKSHPHTAEIPILIVTAKHITADDRVRLNGQVSNIVEKSEFNHGRFMNEVRRALMTGKERT